MKTSLQERATDFLSDLRKRQLRSTRANLALVLASLAFAVSAIVLGIYDKGVFAACCGILVGGLIACDRAFGFGAVSDYLPAIIVEAEILAERIADAETDPVLKRIYSELKVLRRTVAQSTPLGLKMEAIAAFYEKYNRTPPLGAPPSEKQPKRIPSRKGGTKKKTKTPTV